MADGITTSLLADVTAKCMMADVIAIVADGMATYSDRLMLLSLWQME